MADISSMKLRVEEIERELALLNIEAKPIREQISAIDRQRGTLTNEMASIRSQLAEISKDPRVSDDAVIRFLERKYGFSFEAVRSELLTPTVVAAMNFGAESVKFHGGRLVIKGKTIVTFTN